MGKVFSYIRDFYRTHFNAAYFSFIVLLMGSLVYINYQYGLDRDWIGQYARSYKMFLAYWLLFFSIFSVAYLSYSVFSGNYSYWKQPLFIFLLLAGPAIFAFQQYFYWHRVWIENNISSELKHYYGLSSEYVLRVFLLLIPTFILWLFLDKGKQNYYGFNRNTEGYRPYWTMLLIMLPLIGFASTQNDFLQYYPKAKLIEQTSAAGLEKFWLYLKFELAYGFNFITIESFFRGFLILAFTKYAGKAAIIPMACFYCSIHFGKPMFECISSFFGGLLLGIVVFNTRSIWGGLMVHLGIAWLMEFGAMAGNLIKH